MIFCTAIFISFKSPAFDLFNCWTKTYLIAHWKFGFLLIFVGNLKLRNSKFDLKKNPNYCTLLNSYALKWYENLKKSFSGPNFVQKCGVHTVDPAKNSVCSLNIRCASLVLYYSPWPQIVTLFAFFVFFFFGKKWQFEVMDCSTAHQLYISEHAKNITNISCSTSQNITYF